MKNKNIERHKHKPFTSNICVCFEGIESVTNKSAHNVNATMYERAGITYHIAKSGEAVIVKPPPSEKAIQQTGAPTRMATAEK